MFIPLRLKQETQLGSNESLAIHSLQQFSLVLALQTGHVYTTRITRDFLM